MKTVKKKIIAFIMALVAVLLLCVSCNDAGIVQHNIAQKSDKFETYRVVTVINLRSDKILLEVEGYISIKNSSTDELAIIIMTGPNQYKMHYIYLGAQIVYLVEQTENTSTDPYHWDIRIHAVVPEFI